MNTNKNEESASYIKKEKKSMYMVINDEQFETWSKTFAFYNVKSKLYYQRKQ